MKRLIASLALGAAVLAAIPGGAETIDTGNFPACSGGPGFTCTDLFIPSWDGTKLDATLYTPDVTVAGGAPAILTTHGYGGWHRGSGDMGRQRTFAAEGYVVLAWTSRGFGRSEGNVQLQSVDWEVKDVSALLDYLATLPGVRLDAAGDPRVGMIGWSYAGGIQLQGAGADSRIDAIAPEITWGDLRYSLAPNGVVKHGWIDLLYASGKYAGYMGPLGTFPPPVVGTDGVGADQDVQVLSTYLANDNVEGVPYSDGSTSSYEYLTKRSALANGLIENITAPTLLIQGQKDTLFTLNETIRNAAAIADNTPGGVPVKVVSYSAGHGYSDLPGERNAINARILSWFDRYLNGNTSASTGPAVELWQPHIAGTNFLGLAALPPLNFFSGELAGEQTIVNTVAPTAHTETTNFQSSTGSPHTDPAGVAWDLGVPAGTTIAGAGQARFIVDTTATEAIVFLKLVDVDTATGKQTVVHNLVTPVRLRGGKGDFCGDDLLPGPLGTAPLTMQEACVELGAGVWKVQSGHRLELRFSATDTMYLNGRQPAAITIANVSVDLPTL